MMTLSITIEESLIKELDQGIKKVSAKGRSQAIRMAIREWLDRHALQKKVQQEIKGYQKKPVSQKEFAPLLALQEWPE